MIDAQHKARRAQSGFTLIELMVVVAIIAILSTIGIGGFSNAQRRARDARRRADIKTIQSQMVSSADTQGNLDTLAAVREAGGRLPEDPGRHGQYLLVAPALGTGGNSALLPEELESIQNAIPNIGDQIVFQNITNNTGFACARLEVPNSGNAIEIDDTGNPADPTEAAAETRWRPDIFDNPSNALQVTSANVPANGPGGVSMEFQNGTFVMTPCHSDNCNLFCATF